MARGTKWALWGIGAVGLVVVVGFFVLRGPARSRRTCSGRSEIVQRLSDDFDADVDLAWPEYQILYQQAAGSIRRRRSGLTES